MIENNKIDTNNISSEIKVKSSGFGGSNKIVHGDINSGYFDNNKIDGSE